MPATACWCAVSCTGHPESDMRRVYAVCVLVLALMLLLAALAPSPTF